MYEDKFPHALIYGRLKFCELFNRNGEDYVYVKGEYQSTLQKLKHYLRHENKVNKIRHYYIVKH